MVATSKEIILLDLAEEEQIEYTYEFPSIRRKKFLGIVDYDEDSYEELPSGDIIALIERNDLNLSNGMVLKIHN